MKLLLVHRFIRPDTPGYAHMLYIMGQHFAAEGHDVTIFSAQPGYNDVYDGEPLPVRQQVDGMTVIRIPLLKESKSKKPLIRAVNFFWFAMRVFFHAVFRFKAYDCMTVTTFPPTLMATVARMIGLFRKTNYIYHCMDLYPEIALASGMVKKKSMAMKLAAWLDKRNCEKADSVVVLSQDMLDTLGQRGIGTSNVKVLNNFVIDDVDPNIELPETITLPPDKFRVLFAGNIGRFQSLDTIVEAAKIIGFDERLEFWFVGTGVAVDSLKEQAGELLGQTIFFHPYLPIQQVMRVIHESHLGIVSLSPGVIQSAYPSKTMSYLEAGCKLLCVLETDSSLSRMVRTDKIGETCEADADQVAEAVSKEFELWSHSQYDRQKVQNIGRSRFGRPYILEQWSRIFRGEEIQEPLVDTGDTVPQNAKIA